MKFNFKEFNARLQALVKTTDLLKPCKKLAIDNIILPCWNELGLFAMMHKYSVYTAESPNGCDYPADKYQTVVRILGGQLLFDDPRRINHGGKRTDNYCWEREKVSKLVKDGLTKPIGNMSTEGKSNLASVIDSIKSEAEKKLFADMFALVNLNMILAHTPAEDRFFIRVTQELYDAGWDFTVDEWQVYKLDENGDADTTELCIGDVIIVTSQPDGTVTGYRIDEAMFEQTHEY